jgi:hypothetical protein
MATRKKKKSKTPAKPKARGPKDTGAVKRTPQHIADIAAVEDQVYEVEAIIAAGKQFGVATYLVKWKGWGEKQNTWEPLTHLVGAEVLVREFNVEARKLDEVSLVRLKQVASDRAAAAAAQKQAGQELMAAKLAAALSDGDRDDDAQSPQKKQRRAAIYKFYKQDPVETGKM